MNRTCAIHAIWTTYGTLLPGDPAKPGHWSPLYDLYDHLIRAGYQLNLPDPVTYAIAKSRMKEPAKVLSREEQTMVAEVIGAQLAPGMPGSQWRIFAGAIERTHVHLLFGPLHDDIGNVIGRIKSRTCSTLLKHPDNWGRTRIWTNGNWKVSLFHAVAQNVVARYVRAHNLRRGLDANPWAWIRPE